MVQAARLNQWVVRGETLDQVALDEAVRDNFRCTARSIFDLYHNINNPKVFRQIVDLHPTAEHLIERPEFAERGLVVAGIHMSNFDFIGQAAGIAGAPPRRDHAGGDDEAGKPGRSHRWQCIGDAVTRGRPAVATRRKKGEEPRGSSRRLRRVP